MPDPLDQYSFDFYAGGIKNKYATASVTLSEIRDRIRSDSYSLATTKVRSADYATGKKLKEKMDYVTFCGHFLPFRLAENVQAHSGIICLDFDDIVPEDFYAIRLQLQADPYTLMLFESPSGGRLKLIVLVPDLTQPGELPLDKRHSNLFADLAMYYRQTYNLLADASGSDVSRACYLPCDPNLSVQPDALPYHNKGLVQKKERPPRSEAQQVVDASDVYRHVLAVVERIEAAKVDISGGSGEYDVRLLLAFCMSTLGEDGRDLLHRILQFYPNYTVEETDSKFDQGRDKSRFTTPWKFFQIAKQHGIDVSKPKGEKEGKAKKPARAADRVEQSVDGLPAQPAVVEELRKNFLNWDTNGTVTYDCDEMMIHIKSGKNSRNTVADNFLLYVTYLTEDEDENLTWVLEIRPVDGESIYVEVPHEEFNSASKLKRILSGKQFALKISDTELSELHGYLFNRTKFNRATKIIRYGYHAPSGVFFFANKALNGSLLEPDQFGMVRTEREGKSLYLSMPANNRHKAHRFTLTDHQLKVNDFFPVYAAAHGYENALVPFCFYMMALYRDLALKHKNFSPILYLKGGAGTGKSSMIRVLTAAFGRKQDGVNLKSKNSEPALVKLMSQSSNTIIWFDEYHNEITCEGLLQAAYDNDGYHLTKAGTVGTNETDSIDIYSALALTSNYLPENPIFFSRCVFVAITSQDKTPDQVTAYNQLEAWQEEGLGCMTLELLAHRPLVEQQYGASYTLLLNGLKKAFAGEKIPERFFANMAQLLTVGFTLAATGKLSLTESSGVQDVLAEFVAIGAANIRRQFRIVSEKTALSEFLEIVQQLYDQYQIHDQVHFDIVAVGKHLTVELWFPQLYNLYAMHYRRMTQRSPADRDSLQQEIAAFEEQADWDAMKKSIRFTNDGEGNAKAKSTPRPNCCVMNYSKLQEKYGLDLEARKPRSQ